jgi:competence ComEA-like helix-hairpin-helix protein
MKRWLTPEERRTLAAVLALVAAGYALVGWRSWREPALPVAPDSLDRVFARLGAEMAADSLPATPGEASGDGAKARASTPARPARPVDLNRADSLALLGLPRIGPAKASAILAWRRAHGRFRCVEDLLEVGGIGPATLARLRPHLTLDADSTKRRRGSP